MEGIWYELPDYAFNYYKKHVKGNENITKTEAEKKINRNILLGKTLFNGKRNKLVLYGSLMIKTKHNKVIYLKNNIRPDDSWEIHKKKFNKLNRQFGIQSNREVR